MNDEIAKPDSSFWVVVPAAGRGVRFGSQTPKQYALIDDKPILQHTLEALLSHPKIAGAIVAISQDDIDYPKWAALCDKPVISCIGGAHRSESVLRALLALPEGLSDNAFVLVHDAARPNIDIEDLTRLINAAQKNSCGAILAVPVADTLKRADANSVIESTLDRAQLWRALTPQMFPKNALISALKDVSENLVSITDESMAMEHVDVFATLVEGNADNIKVTTPSDLAMMTFLLRQKRITKK